MWCGGRHVYGVYMPASTTAYKIACAARELLEKEGSEALSMRRVAGAVGITPMAIYRHYPDREALLNAVANAGFEELAASLKRRRFRGKLETRMLHMANIYLDHALQNPRLFELMFLRKREGARVYPQDFEARQSPTANQMADLVEEGMACGELRRDNLWEVVFEMGAMSHGLIMLYLGGRIALSPDQFRAFYQRSFRRYIHGILV
jgi:AcrR family transcriptional regulator